MKHNGKIGNTKDVATRLCNGKYLIELDHDDMLTDYAVDEVRKAFDSDPEIGMVYTNCAAFYPDGSPQQYQDDFWKDRYRDTEYRGKVYKECINPDIYGRFGPYHQQQFGWFLTVGPNHIRAYRAETLRELGGYNSRLPITDDWDLFARFFLRSKCYHLDKLCYLYRFHDGWKNTTFTRNKSIQDHLELGRKHYEQEFIEFNTKRMMEEKLLSVIVLDWNTPELTDRCIKSVRGSCPESEIVLVQNGRHFDCPEADKIVPLEANLGFAAGCNTGALHASTEYLCFLNSDTVVEGDVLHRLVANVSDPNVGIAVPYSNKAKPPQGYYEKGQTPGTQDVDSVVGFCMVIRRGLFENLGGFDPRFCNFEDDDLSRRVREKGLLCRIVENTWVYHEENASFKANGLDAQAEIRKSEKVFHAKYPNVKVIAITLNEKDCLPGFFDQFRHITNDFAILDSGSTDGTIEWAKESGVKVAHRDFDDFASQRNAATRMFGGDSDWIVMFDPDERLDEETLNNFWELVRQDQYEIFLAPLWARHPDGSERQWVSKPFLYKNSEKIHWIFSVHEKLIGSYKQALIRNAKLTHMLEYHSPERRNDMSVFYASLQKEERALAGDFPILDYEHVDDDRIDKIYLGPLISVLIPTYKREDLLGRAIGSALIQDYMPLEVVVVGDACPELNCAFDDTRIRTFNLPENHGAGGAVPRNYGIMLSRGAWIAYLDDDNLLKRNHLSSIFESMRIASASFGLSSMEVDGKPLICEKPEFGSVDTSCLLHRKSLVRDFGWWKNREEDGYAHDWMFVSRWVDGGVRWVATKTPTVIYNRHTSGQSEYLATRVGLSEGDS
jgi:GT2 family glycosyltransferase/glycosyltransferase involved in cell wall biosynthesis